MDDTDEKSIDNGAFNNINTPVNSLKSEPDESSSDEPLDYESMIKKNTEERIKVMKELGLIDAKTKLDKMIERKFKTPKKEKDKSKITPQKRKTQSNDPNQSLNESLNSIEVEQDIPTTTPHKRRSTRINILNETLNNSINSPKVESFKYSYKKNILPQDDDEDRPDFVLDVPALRIAKSSCHDPMNWCTRRNRVTDFGKKFPDSFMTTFNLNMETPVVKGMNSKNCRLDIRYHKNINGKFPLRMGCHSSVPLNTPRISLFSSCNNSNNNINSCCMDTVCADNDIIIGYVDHTQSCKSVKIVKFDEDFTESTSSMKALKPMYKFNVDEPCSKICLKKIGKHLVCLFQAGNVVDYHLITGSEIVSAKNGDLCCEKELVYDIALNPVHQSCYVCINNNGKLGSYNPEYVSPLTTYTFPLESEHSKIICDFGYHSQQVNVICNEKLQTLDLRTKDSISLKFDVSTLEKYALTSINQVGSFRQVSNKPYSYINCLTNIFLIDERFSKIPVLTWDHMLESLPDLTTNTLSDDLDFHVVANSLNNKICIVPNNWEQSNSYVDMYCKSLSLPKQFNILSDALGYASSQNIWKNSQVETRINMPWTGCSMMKSLQNDKTYFFSINSCNDIFMQSFCDIDESMNDVDDKILTNWLSDWEKKVIIKDSEYNKNPSMIDMSLFCSGSNKSDVSSLSEPNCWKLDNIIGNLSGKLNSYFTFTNTHIRNYEGTHKTNLELLGTSDFPYKNFSWQMINPKSYEKLLECNDMVSKKVLDTWLPDKCNTHEIKPSFYEIPCLDTTSFLKPLSKVEKKDETNEGSNIDTNFKQDFFSSTPIDTKPSQSIFQSVEPSSSVLAINKSARHQADGASTRLAPTPLLGSSQSILDSSLLTRETPTRSRNSKSKRKKRNDGF